MKKLSRNKKILIVLLLSALIIASAVAYPTLRSDKPQDQPSQADNQPAKEKEDEASQPDATQSDQTETPVKEYELVTENEKYKIRREPDSNKYTITLYAIINRPEQHDQYHDQLREYKQEALQYLQSSGVDTNKLDITYDPVEAKDL